jgi:site-specific recombinase XerD
MNLPQTSHCTSFKEYTQEHILYHVPDYIKSMKDYGRSDLTARNVQDSLKLFIKVSGCEFVKDLNNNTLVASWLLETTGERSWSPATHNSYRKNLIAFVNYLERSNIVSSNKLKLLPKMKEKVKRTYYLSEEQVETILKSIDKIYDKTFYRVRNKLVFRLIRKLILVNYFSSSFLTCFEWFFKLCGCTH